MLLADSSFKETFSEALPPLVRKEGISAFPPHGGTKRDKRREWDRGASLHISFAPIRALSVHGTQTHNTELELCLQGHTLSPDLVRRSTWEEI